MEKTCISHKASLGAMVRRSTSSSAFSFGWAAVTKCGSTGSRSAPAVTADPGVASSQGKKGPGTNPSPGNEGTGFETSPWRV
ncbi:hypothetical protein ACOMHN_042636 [Nucella lapillus]